MKRWVLLAVIICGAAAALYYAFYGPTYTWHQTLTVVVDTPTGPKSGSATIEVKRWLKHGIPGFGTLGGASVRGEATVVEVSPGRYLFALLRSEASVDHPNYVATHTFRDQLDMTDANATWSGLERLKATAPVPRDRYPMLVTFEDVSDPASVKLVDPDNLATIFGDGINLKVITLTLSNADVTEGLIKKTLNWWVDPVATEARPWKGSSTLVINTVAGLKKTVGGH